VEALSKGLPVGSTLSVSVFHVGAYGEGQWANSQPLSSYTGVSLALLRSEVAEKITRLNLMAYDASTAYDPLEALAAYQNYFTPEPPKWGSSLPSVGPDRNVHVRPGRGRV
jgi:hypothetical protein